MSATPSARCSSGVIVRSSMLKSSYSELGTVGSSWITYKAFAPNGSADLYTLNPAACCFSVASCVFAKPALSLPTISSKSAVLSGLICTSRMPAGVVKGTFGAAGAAGAAAGCCCVVVVAVPDVVVWANAAAGASTTVRAKTLVTKERIPISSLGDGWGTVTLQQVTQKQP